MYSYHTFRTNCSDVDIQKFCYFLFTPRFCTFYSLTNFFRFSRSWTAKIETCFALYNVTLNSTCSGCRFGQLHFGFQHQPYSVLLDAFFSHKRKVSNIKCAFNYLRILTNNCTYRYRRNDNKSDVFISTDTHMYYLLCTLRTFQNIFCFQVSDRTYLCYGFQV